MLSKEISSLPQLIADKPLTAIQIKTISGEKIRIKVNLSITILQLAATIVKEARTALLSNTNTNNNTNTNTNNTESDDHIHCDFTLMAGYPPKQLIDMNMTVEDAGLQLGNITQLAVEE